MGVLTAGPAIATKSAPVTKYEEMMTRPRAPLAQGRHAEAALCRIDHGYRVPLSPTVEENQ